MRMSWKNRSRGRQLVLLAAVSCLLLILLCLTTVHVSRVPTPTAVHCSSDLLTKQADPDLLTLYFTPRPHPVTMVVSRFLLQPHPHTCTSRLDLLIVVPSPPAAIYRREAIRKTWGSVVSESWPQSKTERKVALVFLLGRKGEEKNTDLTALKQESATYGDLLVGDFVDSYRNLTRKILAGLNWVSRHCSERVSYVLKADQDTFVNVDLLLDIIFQLQGNQPMTNTMLGELLCSEPVRRNPDSRVYVDSSVYPFSVYPPYVRGGSYVLSGKLVARLVNVSQHMPFLPVEDAFINGVVAHTLGVEHIHLPGVMKGLACPISPCLFLGMQQVSATDVDPQMMQAIWQQLQHGSHQRCQNQASWWIQACVWLSNRLN